MDLYTIIITIVIVAFLIPWKKIIPSKPKQTTWCYCPSCKTDLCSNDSLIHNSVETGEVIYKCRGCGNVSWWNFGIAPCPILIKSDEGSSDIKPREENECTATTADIN